MLMSVFLVALRHLMIVACLLVSLSSMADSIPEPYLNPHTYYSQNNEFSLSVTPSDRYGFGPASYVFKRGAQELWRKELAYTFKDAAVGNKGEIAGFSYTKGDLKVRSVLQLWVLDAQANVKYTHSHIRRSGAIDGPHIPYAEGVVIHNFNNRATFLLGGIEGKTLWFSVDLHTGKELPSAKQAYNFYELRQFSTSDKSEYSLVGLEHSHDKNGAWYSDIEFCLLDKNWQSLFCKSYSDDLSQSDEDIKSKNAFRFSNPSYFGFTEPDRFWVSSLKEKRKDYFYIEKLFFIAPQVKPVGSKPLVVPKVDPVAAQAPVATPTKTFKLESETPLPDAILKQRQLADVWVFGIDNNQQKAVLSQFAIRKALLF
jgi:hypothetical protein